MALFSVERDCVTAVRMPSRATEGELYVFAGRHLDVLQMKGSEDTVFVVILHVCGNMKRELQKDGSP